MRARDFMLFTICVGISAPLILLTGVFSAGPRGISDDMIKAVFSAGIIAALAGGGVSIMGFNFKVPAVLLAYGGLYVGSSSMMLTLIAQLIKPAGVATIFSGVFFLLFLVIGVLGALEIAGGPHSPMG